MKTQFNLDLKHWILFPVGGLFLGLSSYVDLHASPRAVAIGETVQKSSAIRLAAGRSHTCLIKDDGTVRCWGNNRSGQLGIGNSNPDNRLLPVGVVTSNNAPLTSVVTIATGASHTCALNAAGGVHCWGANSSGELGNGTKTSQAVPVSVNGLANAVSLTAGFDYTCALIADGTARCWGSNADGGLGYDSETDSLTPVPVSGLTNIVAISAGDDHTCAVIANGTVQCWGNNGNGQLGPNGPGPGPGQITTSPVSVTGVSNALALAAGAGHTCALIADGTARCWGLNFRGQLGDGTTIDRITPVAVSGLTNAVALAAGAAHTCALLADGSTRCWGLNNLGQLGDGTLSNRSLPIAVIGMANAIAITGGNRYTCALLVDGAESCWGENDSGQLGNGTTSTSLTPTPVAVGTGSIVARGIAGGGAVIQKEMHHTCALRGNSTVACWGGNSSGQLGNGGNSSQLLPASVISATNLPLSGVVTLAAGIDHTCAVIFNGTVRCWGDNENGQIGNPAAGVTQPSGGLVVLNPNNTPLSNITNIAAGGGHTCALIADGSVRCWGMNSSGQLGPNGPNPGPGQYTATPVLVAGLTHVIAIAAGTAHTCALAASGTVQCWGNNSSGQLGANGPGSGAGQFTATPVTVAGVSNAVSITAGLLHTCALLADGSARCWGDNDFGQVGDGTTSDTTSPATVISLTNAVAITAGNFHTCALIRGGGIAKCWGMNDSGQLGIGTTVNRSIPTSVTLNPSPGATLTAILGNAVQISAGSFHTCALKADGSPFCWGNNISGQIGDGTSTNRLRAVAVPRFHK